MTQTLRLFIEGALISNTVLCVVMCAFIVSKMEKRPSTRFKERVYDNLERHNEQITELEMQIDKIKRTKKP